MWVWSVKIPFLVQFICIFFGCQYRFLCSMIVIECMDLYSLMDVGDQTRWECILEILTYVSLQLSLFFFFVEILIYQWQTMSVKWVISFNTRSTFVPNKTCSMDLFIQYWCTFFSAYSVESHKLIKDKRLSEVTYCLGCDLHDYF